MKKVESDGSIEDRESLFILNSLSFDVFLLIIPM